MVLVGGGIGRKWLVRCRQVHARPPSRRKILDDMRGMGKKVGQVGKPNWDGKVQY